MQSAAAQELLPDAAGVVSDLVGRLRPADLDAPSPCAGWRVRDVLNHLVAEHRWAPELLAGRTIEDVGDRYDGDLLGADPVAAWHGAIAESLAAWAAADPSRIIQMSFGPCTTAEYAEQMLVDLTVHAWDMARGAGIAIELDPDCVEHCIAYERPRVQAGGVDGIFAPPVPISEDAPPQDLLVALLGRDPHWAPL